MGLESEKAFPFDAEKDSMGNYDRVYYADDFARYFRSFISSGIFLKEHDNLQVIANDDMSVTIRPGAIIIDGYHYENTEDIIVQLDPADGVLNRIDRISISWIKEERDAHKIVQKGESSYEPIPPECRRNAEYKDYVLADVYVAAGVIKITQDNITDQRLNTDVCGLAIAFSEIDTTLIFNQLQAFYEKVKSENADWAKEKQEAFDKWFENIKNQLEDDVAANLQKQIGALANLKTTNKSDLVSAINELAKKKIDVLDTMEEVEANTDSGKVAGALALKEEAERNGIDTKLIDGVPHWSARGADTWSPFSSYKNVKIANNASGTGSAISTLTVPKNINSGIIMFMNAGYTSIVSPPISIPSDVEYEEIFPLTKLCDGSAEVMHTNVRVIKASNIGGKTLKIGSGGPYYRSYIWLFY